MKVVMLDTGKVKEVSDGYARNFLLPKNLAKAATKSAIVESEKQQLIQTAQQAQMQAEAEATVKAVQGKLVELPVKANETGGLFAAVSVSEVVKAVQQQLKVTLEADIVQLPVIKMLGEYSVTVQWPNQVPVQFRLNVTK